jgi:hypothetical protein
MPEKILCNITVYGSGGVSTEEKTFQRLLQETSREVGQK